MKKVITAVLVLLVSMFSVVFSAFAEKIDLPVIDGKICGYTVTASGSLYDKGATKFIGKMKKQKTRVADRRRYKGCNTEVATEKWLSVEAECRMVSGRFTTAQEAIEASTKSTRAGYGGIAAFDEKGRSEASLDMVITFPNGITMGIGTSDSGVTALVRYMTPEEAKATFARGKAEVTQAEIVIRKQEELQAYEPTIEEITEMGGIVISSSF